MDRQNRISIRAFAPADTERCVRLFDRAWHAGHPYAPRRVDRAAFAAETKGEEVLVAVTAEGIAGFVSLYAPGRFIHHLYVDPDLQGRGIGRALLDRAVKLAGGRASLKCQLRNARAIRFYRRLGWREADTGGDEDMPWVRMLNPER
jgi:GNAT superfamily N-acetyltransferase